jgi:hypothetical protein
MLIDEYRFAVRVRSIAADRLKAERLVEVP